jgi:hypothetical protein
MQEQRIETRFDRSMATVFDAVVLELGSGRWSGVGSERVRLPKAGLRFGYRINRRLYCGTVLECLRPVSIVIVESYHGPAASIVARQRWRVDCLESGTRLTAAVQFEPNRFARLQLRFWKSWFLARARQTCAGVRARIYREDSANWAWQVTDSRSCAVPSKCDDRPQHWKRQHRQRKDDERQRDTDAQKVDESIPSRTHDEQIRRM